MKLELGIFCSYRHRNQAFYLKMKTELGLGV